MPPAVSNMSGTHHLGNGSHSQSDRETLRQELSYNEMTVGANGSVMDKREKAALRKRHGFCVECMGIPVELYMIKKSRMNPLWVTKEPRDVPGVCLDGVCLVCHPELDPQRRGTNYRRSNRPTPNGGPTSNSGGNMRSDHLQSPQLRPGSKPSAQYSSTALPRHPPLSDADGATANGIITASVSIATDSRATSIPSDVAMPPHSAAGNHHAGQQSRHHQHHHHQASIPPSTHSSVLQSPVQPHKRPSLSNSPGQGQRATPRTIQGKKPKPVFESGIFVVPSENPKEIKLEVPDIDAEQGDNLDQIFHSAMDKSTRSLECKDLEFQASASASAAGTVSSAASAGGESSTSFDPRPPSRLPSQESAGMSRSSTPELSESASASASAAAPGSLPENDTASSSAPVSASLDNLLEGDEEAAGILEHVQGFVDELLQTPDVDSNFLAEVVLGAMREHRTKLQVQVYCLRTIWDICKEDDKNKEACMASSAPSDIMQAMKEFPQALAIQEKGCGAIWSLGVNTDNRVILVRLGACERVVMALREFASNESLARTAIGALRTLSPELEARESFKPLKASECTVRAMEFHRHSVSIQRDGCAFLSNCAVNIEKQFVAVVPLEELDAVVQAMQAHRNEVAVMAGGCFALKNYTYEQKNCRTLRQCDGIEELLAYATSFERSSACRADAAELLERMQLSRVADESIESHESMQLRTAISQTATPDDAIRTILEFMRNNDWSPILVASSVECLRELFTEYDTLKDQFLDDGLTDVIRLVGAHGRDASLMEEGLQLLASLSDGIETNQPRQDLMLNIGVCTTIFNILRRHIHNLQVVKAALSALNPLSSNFDCWREDEGAEMTRINVVRDAVTLHADCDIVGMHGISVISNHEMFES